MVWLWVPAFYRCFWLLNSSVPPTPAQVAGQESLYQGSFPTQRPSRGPSITSCPLQSRRWEYWWTSQSHECLLPMWSWVWWGRLRVTLRVMLAQLRGWDPHSLISWSTTSTETWSTIRTRVSWELIWGFLLQSWPLTEEFCLYCFLPVPTINRVLDPLERQ